jgi:hypothetical protein
MLFGQELHKFWIDGVYRRNRIFFLACAITFSIGLVLLVSTSSIPSRLSHLDDGWFSSQSFAPVVFRMSLFLSLIAAGILGWLSLENMSATTTTVSRSSEDDVGANSASDKKTRLASGIAFGLVIAILTYLSATLGVAGVPRSIYLLLQLGVVVGGVFWIAVSVRGELARLRKEGVSKKACFALVSLAASTVGIVGLVAVLSAIFI